MGRYAVIGPDNVVQNVIEWDGVAKWNPPSGCTLKPHDQVGRGDVWDGVREDFLRPLKNLMMPEDEGSLAQREKAFQEAKAKFKSGITIINDSGDHEQL